MSDQNDLNPEENQVPLQDIVLSNSWALQAILLYLEEIHPGSRDRIWQHYLEMKNSIQQNEPSQNNGSDNDEGNTDQASHE